MFPGNEDGKIGFIVTLIAMLLLGGSFARTAFTGADFSLEVTVGAVAAMLAGHFMLGGGEFRKKMIEEKKK